MKGQPEQSGKTRPYSTNHVYLHRFLRLRLKILRLRLKRKTHPAFRVLNAFYFQTDFNLRFKRKRDVRCKRVLVNAFDASYIAHYSSNGYAPLTSHIIAQIDLTRGLNETKPTKRSQITYQNLRKEANAKCAVSVHAKRVSNS